MGIGSFAASLNSLSATAGRRRSTDALPREVAGRVRARDAKRDALRRVPGLPLPERLRDRVAWSVARPRVSRLDRTRPNPPCYAELAGQTP